MAPSTTNAETDTVPWVASCARAIAVRTELPGLTSANSRGAADALACHARFGLSSAWGALRPPGVAGTLFDALDEARSETLGARWLPGVAHNLIARTEGAPADLKELWRRWAFAVLHLHPVSCPADFVHEVGGLRATLAEEQFAPAAAALAISRAQAWHIEALERWSLNPGTVPLAQQHNDDSRLPPAEAAEALPTVDRDAAARIEPLALPAAIAADYPVFSRRHDRVLKPEQLATSAELASLRADLDAELAPYRKEVTRLAHQLQRVLLARQRQRWESDQEEGQLDSSRLARLVADPAQTRTFRFESKAAFRNSAVTLLIDNSGSMRGRPILIAAMTADILARTLERCAIPVEVLGFTTEDSEGGAPRREWEQAGRPAAPGRLNALRHVLYKPMATPWRRARLGLGAMLKDGLLMENIDGEALAWASQRLLKRVESRRVLVVVSDGAPMDRSTKSANPTALLEQHLHQVVSWIEGRTDLELCAIGIGHSVARYYRRSLRVDRVEALGPALCQSLAEWLV